MHTLLLIAREVAATIRVEIRFARANAALRAAIIERDRQEARIAAAQAALREVRP
jgi:hypothetical protein